MTVAVRWRAGLDEHRGGLLPSGRSGAASWTSLPGESCDTARLGDTRGSLRIRGDGGGARSCLLR